ncbi:MAG: hypothetical protein DRP75_04240 [Candidatus Omnitrophota bacterium]|nr:MAG: hypothetical protein DRP75_04240 [Candidatus Omnitrophota bacterium]
MLITVEEKQRIARELKKMTKLRMETQERLEKEIKKVKLLQENLNAERTEKKSLLSTLKQKKEEIERLTEELKTQKEKEKILSARVKTLQEEKRKVLARLSDLEKEKEVSLKKIVVKPSPEFTGKVLIVNRRFNFLMIDLGEEDGLTPGIVLGVYRNNNLLAKIKVKAVYQHIAEASILKARAPISKGDKVQSILTEVEE